MEIYAIYWYKRKQFYLNIESWGELSSIRFAYWGEKKYKSSIVRCLVKNLRTDESWSVTTKRGPVMSNNLICYWQHITLLTFLMIGRIKTDRRIVWKAFKNITCCKKIFSSCKGTLSKRKCHIWNIDRFSLVQVIQE